MFNLKGHVAIVTGGSSGIGLGFARGLAKSGASVEIWARDRDRLHRAETEIRELGCGAVRVVCCDVGQEAAVKNAIKSCVAHFGRLDSFFANAGTGVTAPLSGTDLESYRRINSVNFESMLIGFREASQQMICQGQGGKLIATSSTAGISGTSDLVAYSATKGAILSAVRSMAVELGPHNIQVNAVVPGVIKTDMNSHMDGLYERVLSKIPSTFVADPSHVEGLAVFLAARESDYIPGASIPIDGGLSITTEWS